MGDHSSYTICDPKTVILHNAQDMCFHYMQQALKSMKGQRIQLLTCASPPAGRPPNITGIVKDATGGILKLALSHGEEAVEPRIGVYSICNIIGFVPASGKDWQDGCPEQGEKKSLEEVYEMNCYEVPVDIKHGYVTPKGRVAVSMSLPEGAETIIDLEKVYIANPIDHSDILLTPLEVSIETEENVLVALFEASSMLTVATNNEIVIEIVGRALFLNVISFCIFCRSRNKPHIKVIQVVF